MLDLHSKANIKSTKYPCIFVISVFALPIFFSSPSVLAQTDETRSDETRNTASPGQLTRAPEVIESAKPILGVDAPQLTQDVAVVLELTVGIDGKVSDVVVTEGAHPILDAAAVEAIKRYVFRPAEVDGQPGAVRIHYRFAFEFQPSESNPEPDSPASPLPSKPQVTKPTSPKPVGRLQGEILERGTRKPLAGARVRLVTHDRETLTDAEGHFRFDDVPAQEVEIAVEDTNYESLKDKETIVANKVTDVRYYVERTDFGRDEVVAIGHKPKKEVVRRTISVEEIKSIPGTNGDSLKVIQNLPGAARQSFFGDPIVLRGGGSSEVFVNGQSVPSAFHFGGLRSSLGNGLLESIDVYPGNYSARYGDANGGIVDVKMRRPKTDSLHGYGQVDIFDASAFLEGPACSDGAFALGVRRSYIDALLPLFLSDEDKKTFNTAPQYYDYQGIYDLKTGRHRLRTHLFGSSDRMKLLIDEPVLDDPAIRNNIKHGNHWIASQVLWDYRFDADTTHHSGLSYQYTTERTEVGPDFRLEASAHRWTLRDEITTKLVPWLTLSAGLDFKMDYIDYYVTAPHPPKEGTPQTPLSTQQFIHTEGSVYQIQPAVWTELELEAGPVLIVPGFRLDYFGKADSFDGTLMPQPRLSVRYNIVDKTTLKAGVGMYSQGPELDETNLAFGNPDLKPEKSVHYSTGIEQGITDALLLDITGFYKDLYDLVSQVDDPNIKFNNQGKGRAYGLEVMLKYDRHSRFSGWVAYTLMRSERVDAGTSRYRLFDLDQTHNLTVVAQYRLSQTWEIGSRFRFVTGNPQTPYIGATYDSDADTYVPVAGKINSERIGSFHQLDLRVDKHWIFDTWRLTTYLDIQNVYNRVNPEGISHNFNYTQTKAQGGLPIIPSFGVRGEF